MAAFLLLKISILRRFSFMACKNLIFSPRIGQCLICGSVQDTLFSVLHLDQFHLVAKSASIKKKLSA